MTGRTLRGLAAAAALLAGLRAQEQSLEIREQEQVVLTLRALPSGGGNSPTGVGFVRLEVENRDSRPRTAEVEIATTRGSTADVRLPRTFELAAGERAVAFLPLPRPMVYASLTLRVDGNKQVCGLTTVGGHGIVGLLLSDRPDATPDALKRLQAMEPAAVLTACTAGDAPDDWRLYSGFHAVFVDGRARLGADVQEALRRAASTGVVVVVAGAQALPAGPLRHIVSAVSAGGVLRLGLGCIAAIPPLDADLSGAQGVLATVGDLGVGPLPVCPVLLEPQPIPGLGDAPVSAFLLVILLFALACGPANFLLLRRWRRPLLALVTVPVLGFGTTIVILAYGFLHDGFGVRGVVTSWTALDQVRHEAAAIAMRTLFAGRAPGDLAMGPDALLLAPRATMRAEGAADRWHFDGKNGRLDGGALPSRTATPLVTVQQTVARQRLVALRRGDDGLHLADDGGVAAVGDVVLRDLEGTWFVGQAPDLRRVSPQEGASKLRELQRRAGSVVVEPQMVVQRQGRQRRLLEGEGQSESRPIGGLAGLFGGDPLPPGGYVTQVRTAPWLDEHGLAVAYDLQQHFVRGCMQAEDFGR